MCWIQTRKSTKWVRKKHKTHTELRMKTPLNPISGCCLPQNRGSVQPQCEANNVMRLTSAFFSSARLLTFPSITGFRRLCYHWHGQSDLIKDISSKCQQAKDAHEYKIVLSFWIHTTFLVCLRNLCMIPLKMWQWEIRNTDSGFGLNSRILHRNYKYQSEISIKMCIMFRWEKVSMFWIIQRATK